LTTITQWMLPLTWLTCMPCLYQCLATSY